MHPMCPYFTGLAVGVLITHSVRVGVAESRGAGVKQELEEEE